jgi:hypothetical protein
VLGGTVYLNSSNDFYPGVPTKDLGFYMYLVLAFFKFTQILSGCDEAQRVIFGGSWGLERCWQQSRMKIGVWCYPFVAN